MIDKEKAGKVLDELVKVGLISKAAAVAYANTVEMGISFALFSIQTLGPVVGNRYIAEQFVEYLEHDQKVALDQISVPEMILGECSGKQKWHTKEHFETIEKFFEAESGEPWHPSLRDKHKPLPDVATWFNDRPYSSKLAIKILTTVYKNDA